MGLNIKELAKKRGWSIYKLAVQCNKRANVAMSNVYDWANGKYDPTKENLKLLCEVLECTSEELLGF